MASNGISVSWFVDQMVCAKDTNKRTYPRAYVRSDYLSGEKTKGDCEPALYWCQGRKPSRNHQNQRVVMFIEECARFRARVGIHDKALKSSGSEGFPVLGLLTASRQFPASMLGVLPFFSTSSYLTGTLTRCWLRLQKVHEYVNFDYANHCVL